MIRRDATALPPLRSALREGDAFIRAQAAEAIGWLGTSAACATIDLANALNDEDKAVQLKALWALGRIGDEADSEALDALERALMAADPAISAGAADALAEMGERAVPHVRRALASPEWTVRQSAALALGLLGPVAANVVPDLAKRLNDSHDEVRYRAVEAIGKIGGDEALELLLRVLPRQRDWLLIHTIEAIGTMGEAARTAALALEKLFAHEDPFVCQAAALACWRVGWRMPTVIGVFREMLWHADEDVRCEAALNLQELGSGAAGALPELKHALTDNSADVRIAAAGAIGAMGHKGEPAREALCRALRDAEPAVRRRVTRALESLEN